MLKVVSLILLTFTASQAKPLPAPICEALKVERMKYGPSPTDEEAGKLLNSAIFPFRNQGYGLSGKKAGTNCPSPAGIIACDIIQHNLTMWDVLIAVGNGGPASINCGESIGEQQDPISRPFVTPVDPGSTLPPIDDTAKLKERIKELELALQRTESALAQTKIDLRITGEQRDEAISERDSAISERDAALLALTKVKCEASIKPSWAGALGIRASCKIVTTP